MLGRRVAAEETALGGQNLPSVLHRVRQGSTKAAGHEESRLRRGVNARAAECQTAEAHY